MSIGPIGIPPELDAQRRRVYYEQKAAAAAGVGKPDGDEHAAAEKDGSGRQAWGDRPEQKADSTPANSEQDEPPSSRSGRLLDLTG